MQSFNPSSISFTDAAVNHFKNSLNDKPESFGIRIGVREAGCSGYEYFFEYTNEEQEGNQHIIEDVKFKTYGCGSAIASSAELVEMLIGKTLDEAKEIKNKDLAEVLELPPIKIHCSVLAEDSIKQAIEDYESKQ